MTVTGDSPRSHPRVDAAVPSTGGRLGPDALGEVCPYLRSGEGDWRSAHPSRDQRCVAMNPVAVLPQATQRALCLVDAHRTCSTYAAARASAPAPGRSPGDDGAALWPAVDPMPLVLEPDARIRRLPGRSARTAGQVLLVGLMAVAFLVLIATRATPGPPAQAAATQSLAAVVPASPSSATATAPGLTPSSSPSAAAATTAPTGAPSASPAQTPAQTEQPATARYRVRAGDTLAGIAARLGTTVRVLKRLNGITDPSLIRPGQMLTVPAR